jgi:hypothetical protein
VSASVLYMSLSRAARGPAAGAGAVVFLLVVLAGMTAWIPRLRR